MKVEVVPSLRCLLSNDTASDFIKCNAIICSSYQTATGTQCQGDAFLGAELSPRGLVLLGTMHRMDLAPPASTGTGHTART